MTEPWTPGPWFVHEGYFIGGHDEDGNVPLVAEINGYFHQPVQADARLIAAAPEMAQVLEEVASWNSAPYGFVPLVDEARALLSRIRGEAEVPA